MRKAWPVVNRPPCLGQATVVYCCHAQRQRGSKEVRLVLEDNCLGHRFKEGRGRGDSPTIYQPETALPATPLRTGKVPYRKHSNFLQAGAHRTAPVV